MKNDFFGFPKAKWLQYTGKVGKCTSYRCQIFCGFSTLKIIKVGWLLWELFEKQKGGRIWGHSVYVILWWTSVWQPCIDTCNTLVVENSQLLSSTNVTGIEGFHDKTVRNTRVLIYRRSCAYCSKRDQKSIKCSWKCTANSVLWILIAKRSNSSELFCTLLSNVDNLDF